MTLRYLNEKMYMAVATLDMDEGSIQSRIVMAYRNYLRPGFRDAQQGQYLPDETMATVQDLKLRIESWEDHPPANGAIWDNVERLPTEEAERLASEILELARKVSELYWQ